MYHNFRRDKVIPFTCQSLHLSLLLPVHVFTSALVWCTAGRLQIPTCGTRHHSRDTQFNDGHRQSRIKTKRRKEQRDKAGMRRQKWWWRKRKVQIRR